MQGCCKWILIVHVECVLWRGAFDRLACTRVVPLRCAPRRNCSTSDGDHDPRERSAPPRHAEDLDHLLATELKDKLGAARTRTIIVLSAAKETVRVPVATD